MFGDAVCVHEAFYNQRDFLDKNNSQILKRYRALAGLDKPKKVESENITVAPIVKKELQEYSPRIQ